MENTQESLFGKVLTEMDEAGACFSEWRILDAQYFGVPQRRRRVFLISVFDSATAARCPDPLLPVSEGVRRDTETGNTARQEPAGETATGFGSGGQWPAGENEYGVLRQSISSKWSKGSSGPSGDEFINMVVGSLAARDYKGVGNQYVNENKVVVEAFTKGKRAQTVDDDETWDENRPAPTINAFDQGDTRATTVIVQEPMVFQPGAMVRLGTKPSDGIVPTLRAEVKRGDNEPVIAYETEPVLLTMREGKPGGGKGPLLSTDKSLSLRTGNEQTLFAPIEDPILFENSYRDAARIATEGVTNTLSAKMGTGGNNTPMVAFPIQDGREMEKNQNGIGVADDGTPAYTLDQTGAQAVAYSVREDAKANTFSATELDRANALSALRPSPQSHHAQMFITENVIQYDGYNQKIHVDQPSVTLRIGRDSSDFVAQPAPTTMAVRRLTPLECERLMGWPDDWTAGQSDTHRYKQCGNGVASPVATWIAQQLLKLDQ
jgi:DNA (cytosine-5)-methyltransferase 1